MSECVKKCELETIEAVIDTVIEKGFSDDLLDKPFTVECSCGKNVEIKTFLTVCENCKSTYAITPCHQEQHEYLVVRKGAKMIKEACTGSYIE